MSEWTYVKGSLELCSSPFEVKKEFKDIKPKRENYNSDEEYEKAIDKYRDDFHKARYLPFPEEQFKLGAPIIGTRPDKTKKKIINSLGYEAYPEKPCISFDGTVIYSLPKAKPIIEKAFKLFPQGELGFRYCLDQNSTDADSSTSGFILPCLYKYYHSAIDKFYKTCSSSWKAEWNYKDLNKYIGVDEDCRYDTASDILCGINTSLRSATAEEVYQSLLKFIKYLNDHDIGISNGYLEWNDSYTAYYGYRYAFRTGSWRGEYHIMKLDLNTNETLWKHSHVHPKNGNKTDFDTFVDCIRDLKE